MIGRRHFLTGSAAALAATAVRDVSAQPQPAQITILFDAFGKPSDRLRAGRRRLDLESLRLHGLAQHQRQRLFVFDDEKPSHQRPK